MRSGDREVEAPVPVDARLPEVFRFVILLGAQGGVLQIACQESQLLFKSPVDARRGVSFSDSIARWDRKIFMREAYDLRFAASRSRIVLRTKAMASSAVVKGPW